VQGQDKIRRIEIFATNNRLIIECTSNFSFPVKYINNRPIDNVLMIKGRNLPVLPMGTPVFVIITTKGGKRIRYSCQVGFSGSGQFNVTLFSETADEVEEKRRYYKIKTEISCRIADHMRGETFTPYNPNLYGVIQNINIGGVFLVPDELPEDEVWDVGDVIGFTTVLGNARLETQAKVLRVQRMSNGEVKGYGCAFVHITPSQEEMISSYINYLQLEERRIEREKELLAAEREEAMRKQA